MSFQLPVESYYGVTKEKLFTLLSFCFSKLMSNFPHTFSTLKRIYHILQIELTIGAFTCGICTNKCLKTLLLNIYQKLPSESLLCLLDMTLLSGDSSPLTSSNFGFSTSLTFSGSFLKDPVSTTPFFPLTVSDPPSEEPGLLPASEVGAAGLATGGWHCD